MSNEEILINHTAHETRVAIVAQGAVQELHVERASARGMVSNIYLGKVSRVLPGMQSAFIDIGLERAAFLHVGDLWQSRAHEPLQVLPIEKTLFEGQPLLVQVLKDPLGTKGARLTTQISIAGRLLVYLPQDPHIGVSQRIEDESERAALRARLAALIPPEEKGGFIIRTSAEAAESAEMQADLVYLRTCWQEILAASRRGIVPALLYQGLSLSERVLRDLTTEQTEGIVVDAEAELARLRAFAATYSPETGALLRGYRGELPLFDVHGVEDEIERALSRRVDLKSGGYLVIDQTEALVTVDVNTGGFVGGRSFDDTVFKTNLEAAHAIARQLRLRNLGGIIVIDFIDMVSEAHREAVLTELRRALARDRTRSSVSGFTTLGLVEMTRKRTRESLAHLLCEPCPTCAGTRELKTARTICYDILREIRREATQFNPREFRLMASQAVIDLFLEEEAQPLAALGDAIGKAIALYVEPGYNPQQYDIILT